MQSLSNIPFHNEFVSNFPGDETGDLSPRQTPGKLYSTALPTPVPQVQLLAWSDDLGNELGIAKPASQHDVDILGGNYVTSNMKPYAACYAGHQFGNWAGQLGDGRAITLGEIKVGDGQRELQLKGAGPTAYSRRADGRAVLRSSVREYLMSEAMHYLGVPTTRALSLVATGEPVMRDMFYNGNPANEPGAIVMRVAPTFLRFGNFELLAARRENDLLEKLVNWTIDRYYPHLQGENKITDWYREVLERTAKLMVEWQRVGFVHGVMNTDNMSILGLTIDYGPYSFVDGFDLDFTPNTTDLPGRRYAFGKQPIIGKWNLACLAGAIAPLITDNTILQEILDEYDGIYWANFYTMMGNKLGLDSIQDTDGSLVDDMGKMLQQVKPDMTMYYRLLASLPLDATGKEITSHFETSFYKPLEDAEADVIINIITRYQARIKRNAITREESVNKMNKNNPAFILRNYMLHQAIEALEKDDDSILNKLIDGMKTPYDNKYPGYFAKRPDWAAQKAGCSMLSCSS